VRSPCSTYALSSNGQGCLLQRGLTLSAVDRHGLWPDRVRQVCRTDSTSYVSTETLKHQLSAFFLSRNLQLLKEKVDLLTLHLHGPLKQDEKNYACDHIHN
jgi:hypothetical protein